MTNGQDFTEKELRAAEEAIGYRFRDGELLKMCFTHKSYSNAFGGEDNERLEFLGDAVLELCVTERLYRSVRRDEGELTELRQKLVSQSALEAACKRAGLKRYMRYSGGVQNVGGKTASNLFEAVVAGIYLDGGLEEARSFLWRFLQVTEVENYKTLLQEHVQERAKTLPNYSKPVQREGSFTVRVTALGKEAEGRGRSIQAAETEAAKNLYQILTERGEH